MITKILKLITICFIGISLLGCACKTGPLSEQYGPIDTPIFKPLILDTLKDGSLELNFKEKFVGLYENKELKRFGSFIITEKGVYLVEWHSMSLAYTSMYQININDIKAVTFDNVKRSLLLPDSDILIIEDKKGQKVGFSCTNRFAAKDIIYNLIEKNNK